MDDIYIPNVVGLLYDIRDRKDMKKQLDYTFAITMYNQRNKIVETLESIRFQILRYGREYAIQLIISDDGSEDDGTVVVDEWLSENEELFAQIDKLYAEQNHGTCNSFCNVLERVEGKFFREISGDDILPQGNVFAIMSKLKDYDIITGIILQFDNGQIVSNKKAYTTEIRQAYLTYRDIQSLTKTSVPIKGGALWNKRLNTLSVLEYVRKYRLVEDRPLWYKITQEHRQLKYFFESSVLLLYRANGGSNCKSKVYSIHENDIHFFQEDVQRGKNTWLERESLFCIRHKLKYFNLAIWKVKIKDLIHQRYIRQIWKTCYLPYIKVNQKYLAEIQERSKAFYDREI